MKIPRYGKIKSMLQQDQNPFHSNSKVRMIAISKSITATSMSRTQRHHSPQHSNIKVHIIAILKSMLHQHQNLQPSNIKFHRKAISKSISYPSPYERQMEAVTAVPPAAPTVLWFPNNRLEFT